MIVCVCMRVSDRDIEREVREGCVSYDALQSSLRVGTVCGCCADCARSCFVRAIESDAPARIAQVAQHSDSLAIAA